MLCLNVKRNLPYLNQESDSILLLPWSVYNYMTVGGFMITTMGGGGARWVVCVLLQRLSVQIKPPVHSVILNGGD